MKNIETIFSAGYGGNGVKLQVCLDYKRNSFTVAKINEMKANGTYHENKWLIVDVDDVEQLIKRTIKKEGYHIEKTARQKYPRLKFGNK